MYVHVHTTTCTYHVHTMYIHVYTFTEMYINVCTCLCFSIIVYRQEYDLHMKHAYCHAMMQVLVVQHGVVPAVGILECLVVPLVAPRCSKNCCFSNIRSRDGAKSTLCQAHTKYDSVINRPRKFQTKKINDRNDRNWQIYDKHITEILQEHVKYMTTIWQQYDRSMPKLWQKYDWIMTGV